MADPATGEVLRRFRLNPAVPARRRAAGSNRPDKRHPTQDPDPRLLRIEQYLFPPGGPTSPSIFALYQEIDTKLAGLENRFASQADVAPIFRTCRELAS